VNRLAPELYSRIGNERIELIKFFRETLKDVKLYLVGGYVRDLLLGIDSLDLDFMIEGELKDNLDLVKDRLDKDNIPVKVEHSRFLTAKLMFESPFYTQSGVDFSQTRKETYFAPASTPEVSVGEVSDDLRRRDFTINSLALLLDSEIQLVDLTLGKEDLRNKIIRVHHDKSFIDDPIRLIRAVRFSKRLNFQMENRTEKLFEESLSEGYLNSVSPRRRFEELKKVLSEDAAFEMLETLENCGILKTLCPVATLPRKESFVVGTEWRKRLGTLIQSDTAGWTNYLSTLGLSKRQRQEVVQGF